MVFLLIALLILFIPIPLKININYINKKIQIFIYNRQLKFKTTKYKSKKKKRKLKRNIKINMIKEFVIFLDKSYFKLKIKSKINIDIGIEDAANLAILYGILNSLNYPIYRFISIVFDVSDFEFNITPYFNNKIFSFKSDSIIYLTLAKLIYIVFNIIKFYHLHKKYFEMEVQLSNA